MSVTEYTPMIRNDPNSILRNYIAISSQIHIEGKIDEMKSSPIRRTFCLIILVDFITCILFWIIRNHIYKSSYWEETLNYHFGSSLFDVVVLAAIRFVFLEVIYGGIKSKSLWWISISTTISCVFVLFKMFMASFAGNSKSSYTPGLWDYITIALTFLLVWIETIFLVCRMLPKERAAEQVMAYQTALSHHFMGNHDQVTPKYPQSETSDKMSLTASIEDEFFSQIPTRSESPTLGRNKDIEQKASSLQSLAMLIIRDNSGWIYATGDAIQGCVSYKELPNFKGKMFKIETLLDVPAKVLFNEIVTNSERSPEWNRHVRLVKRIESISNNVDIMYNLSNEALNGYISPRDYVLLRTWGVVDQSYLVSFTSCDHEDCPQEPNVVRGEYGLGAIFLQSKVDLENQCRCIWLMNNDIKGRLFKSIVDRAVPGILLEIIAGLRQHCTTLRI